MGHECFTCTEKIGSGSQGRKQGRFVDRENAFTPPERMQELLEKEGIKVKKDQIQDFKKHFWDPMIELKL